MPPVLRWSLSYPVVYLDNRKCFVLDNQRPVSVLIAVFKDRSVRKKLDLRNLSKFKTVDLQLPEPSQLSPIYVSSLMDMT
jgi:hypothetical protein